MKPVGDLLGLRCAAAHALGVRAMPIATDDPNVRVFSEPRRDRIGGAHPEDIHYRASLQIHQDGAKCCWPFCQAQSSMPTTRSVALRATCFARRFTPRTIVSSLTANPRQPSSRSPPRPPNA
jgi:hypothetical protein